MAQTCEQHRRSQAKYNASHRGAQRARAAAHHRANAPQINQRKRQARKAVAVVKEKKATGSTPSAATVARSARVSKKVATAAIKTSARRAAGQGGKRGRPRTC